MSSWVLFVEVVDVNCTISKHENKCTFIFINKSTIWTFKVHYTKQYLFTDVCVWQTNIVTRSLSF